ncbi:MAG TPA: PQQ-binding-like beta-propeller repeat protein [Pirellulales bacterium]|nr:PQQ-binding-like beta-propeller repeat protein [Pirellulales bacterium]
MPVLPVRFLRVLVLIGFAACCSFASQAAAENWPGWRGPRGDGSSDEPRVPTQWDGEKQENIAWKVEVPGSGHASPVIWQDRIFLVSCLEEEQDRILLCLDRKSGKTLWQKSVLQSPLEKKHALNSYASSTPTTDGKLVYVTFLEGTQHGEAKGAQMAVAAYDLAGEQQWLVRPGPFSSVHGYCSCPVLFEDKLIVNGDHDGDAYLVALDRATGETVWKTPRENKTRSYSTPIIRDFDGRTQMILSGSMSIASYDPRTGSRHWIIDGPTEQFVASMVDNGKLLFMTAGFPEHHILAVRPDGRGNVTKTHVVWRTKENTSYVPSPIAIGDYFLVVSDEGIASCYEAETGRRTWRQRIGPHYSASLVSAGGLAYFLSDEGVTTIVKPGEEYEAIAINPLGEACYASPAISQGQIFLRAAKHLYAVGEGERQARQVGSAPRGS